MTEAQLRKLGIPIPPRPKSAKTAPRSRKSLAIIPSQPSMFPAYCESQGLPRPVPEFVFHPTRLWRFDFAFVDDKIAVEQEGGIFSNGAHVRGEHFISDMQKYREAAILNWMVIRVTVDEMEDGSVFAIIHRAFEARRKS